ncbi:hypothetical protein ABQJ54_18960 [Rhodanobacter sp. Si-c]|uniref:DUF4352 domain-containing protein n=2 Tax=Rhodanobacter lycopersici TaxID=3162487 RepID=A0ABV3QJ08_9GAMM
MMKFVRSSLLGFMPVIMLACAASGSPAISLVKEGVQVSAKLGKISINNATQAHFVHAELTIYNKSKKLKSANLNCLALTVGGVVSDEIDVDSIASVLSDPYPADANGQIKVPVYWVFSAGKVRDIQGLPDAKLSVKSGAASCFRY